MCHVCVCVLGKESRSKSDWMALAYSAHPISTFDEDGISCSHFDAHGCDVVARVGSEWVGVVGVSEMAVSVEQKAFLIGGVDDFDYG